MIFIKMWLKPKYPLLDEDIEPSGRNRTKPSNILIYNRLTVWFIFFINKI